MVVPVMTAVVTPAGTEMVTPAEAAVVAVGITGVGQVAGAVMT